MIFTKPVRRKVAPTGPIVGKPTVPFQPNLAYPKFPNSNAIYFTNLISGQTDYIEDSVAGRGNFAFTGGSMGNHTEGEGYRVIITDGNQGGITDGPDVSSGSWVFLLELQATAVDTTSYNFGFDDSFENSVGFRNAQCTNQNIFYGRPPNNWTCFPEVSDDNLHRIAIRSTRGASAQILSIAIDGSIVYDASMDTYIAGKQNFHFGRKGVYAGINDIMFAAGLWIWTAPFNTGDILTDQEMIDLTTDPWPHLAVLD